MVLMARIRTIKPEFWTDSLMVSLPYEARLLFIGMWNFADDYGCLEDDPDRLAMQVLPNEDVDVDLLIDLLVAAERLNRMEAADGTRFLQILHFDEHQKIDHRSKPLYGEPSTWTKRTVPAVARQGVARKYGCDQGETREAECYYCGAVGLIRWYPARRRGAGWVAFSGLELDHFVPELDGGETAEPNLVLACRRCNRGKGHRHSGTDFLERQALDRAATVVKEEVRDVYSGTLITTRDRKVVPETFDEVSPSPPEDSTNPPRTPPLEGKGREGKGTEQPPRPVHEPTKALVLLEGGVAQAPRPDPVQTVFDAWIEATGRTGRTKLDRKRRGRIRDALTDYPLEDVTDAVRGWRNSPHHRGENRSRTVYNDLELLLRDSAHIEKFRDLERGGDAGSVPDSWHVLRRVAERRARNQGA
jgi:5-methylcytosine-specific restriction endonuclease McrA